MSSENSERIGPTFVHFFIIDDICQGHSRRSRDACFGVRHPQSSSFSRPVGTRLCLAASEVQTTGPNAAAPDDTSIASGVRAVAKGPVY